MFGIYLFITVYVLVRCGRSSTSLIWSQVSYHHSDYCAFGILMGTRLTDSVAQDATLIVKTLHCYTALDRCITDFACLCRVARWCQCNVSLEVPCLSRVLHACIRSGISMQEPNGVCRYCLPYIFCAGMCKEVAGVLLRRPGTLVIDACRLTGCVAQRYP